MRIGSKQRLAGGWAGLAPSSGIHLLPPAVQITELSKEVFKLKESLSDLSELSSHTSVALPKASCPQKAESKQEVASLRGQIKELEQKMLVSSASGQNGGQGQGGGKRCKRTGSLALTWVPQARLG